VNGQVTEEPTDPAPPARRSTPLLSREAALRASRASGDHTIEPVESADAPPEPVRLGPPLSFRARLTLALIAAAIVPLAAFGLAVVATSAAGVDPDFTAPLVLFAIAIAALLSVFVAYLVAASLTAPLRAIAAAVDRVSAGDLSTPIAVSGEDELSRLADSHNRLAADLERRNRELGRILEAIARMSPGDGIHSLTRRAANDARIAFGLIDAAVLLVDPREIPTEEVVPGEPRPVRADLRAGGELLGVLVGRLPATRAWERADQDLLELFASEVAIAIRNAQLFEQVAEQNLQLRELGAAKDDFLRGVSHNLQTPLTSIRAYAEQLATDRPDRRLGIIAEQSERLSRMVRQLLTVSRLESGTLKPRAEVLALAPRVRRAWEALGTGDVAFTLDDRAGGWLAVADADQLDQVLWALLDNAVKHGGRSPVRAEVAVVDRTRLRVMIEDRGAGVTEEDRERLFGRFVRGQGGAEEGSGLGLYVSRELCRAMGGDLVLEPTVEGRGAALSVFLPGEPPDEA
jgi:signal transduction histidine kinase